MEIIGIVKSYLLLGFTHVVPLGFDHILFILILFFLNSNLKSVLVQCTVFTLAHSLSLGLTASGIILSNPAVVEPLIAFSILFTTLENIVHSTVNAYRLIIIFGFGLIHGMGFAGALNEIGLPAKDFLTALLSFNVGVELGQISVILLAYFCIAKWFSQKSWYRSRIVLPLSSLIGCIAFYWLIERVVM